MATTPSGRGKVRPLTGLVSCDSKIRRPTYTSTPDFVRPPYGSSSPACRPSVNGWMFRNARRGAMPRAPTDVTVHTRIDPTGPPPQPFRFVPSIAPCHLHLITPPALFGRGDMTFCAKVTPVDRYGTDSESRDQPLQQNGELYTT